MVDVDVLHGLPITCGASGPGPLGGTDSLVPHPPGYINDGNFSTRSVIDPSVVGDGTFTGWWQVDFGPAPPAISGSYIYIDSVGGWPSDVQWSNSPTGPWTTVGTFSSYAGGNVGNLTFSGGVHRYWRLSKTTVHTGLGFMQTFQVYEWRLYGYFPVLLPPPEEHVEFPVIRGTSLVGIGSTAIETGDGDDPDHDASQIAIIDAGDHFSSTNVEGALQEMAVGNPLAAHVNDPVDAHDASAISLGIGVNVQSALVGIVTDTAAHLADPTVHDAASISFVPTGTISSTNVQDAIAEALAEMDSGPGSSIGGLIPATTTSPNIVTTDGTAVWLPLVSDTGGPVMVETD